MSKKYLISLAVVLLLLTVILWGPIVSNVEQATYTVVTSDGPIEIRDYPPMIVAQTIVTGERKESINKGFRIIADYIFGNNVARQKVAMTAPVMQEPGEKIAMTAPVTQQNDGEEASNNWIVRFMMPSEYTLDRLPKPENPAIQLIEVPGKHVAVIRFSGLAHTEVLHHHENELRFYLDQHNLMAIGQPTYAFFNPPWTLPFLRRNEIMLEVK